MNKFMSMARLPLFLLGGLLLFVADRYLGTETYHLTLRIVAFVCLGLGILTTYLLAGAASGKGLVGESKGWKTLTLWQLLVVAGCGIYLAYLKAMGDKGAPDTFATKALLAGWLLLVVLGLFWGIGAEWAMRSTGRGENAEPHRVSRAGLSWLSIGMLLAFLVTVNYAGDKKDIQRDWSYLKVKTPSESTLKMIGTLTDTMTVAMFYPQVNEVRNAISDYVSALAGRESKIKLEWFDKDMNPAKAEEFKVSQNGQIVLDQGGKKSRINTGTTLAKAKKTVKELDKEFQKSFLELTSDRKTVYFTRGHGEFSWIGDTGENALRSLRLLEAFLKQQNYTTKLFGVSDGSATAVPDDASAVVIVGPTDPFSKEEIDALRAYMDRGGNLMVFMDIEKSTGEVQAPGADGGQTLIPFLGEMGLKFTAVPLANEKNHVTATRSPSDVWFIYSNIFTSHDSVVSLARHDERVAILAYQGGYWNVTPDNGKWRAFETVRAVSDTFADVNRNFKLDPTEKKESYVMGAVAELKAKKDEAGTKAKKMGRVVVFSDATALSDAIVRNVGNALYFSDGMKWLVGESETAGMLATDEDVKIRHTRKEDLVWFYGTVIAVPALVIGAGFLATRRKKGEKGDGDAT